MAIVGVSAIRFRRLKSVNPDTHMFSITGTFDADPSSDPMCRNALETTDKKIYLVTEDELNGVTGERHRELDEMKAEAFDQVKKVVEDYRVFAIANRIVEGAANVEA